MLSNWLSWKLSDPTTYTNFSLFEIEEKTQMDQNIRSHMTRLLQEARLDSAVFQAMANHFGWKETERLLVEITQPTGQKMRRGFFGEVLICAALVELFGYVIPIRKWRYAITTDQSLPGTDAIAIKKQGDAISEVCFVESKLRTTGDTSASVQGYRQLKGDYSQKIPEMIFFVLCRLHESKDPLYEDFLQYVNDRRDLTNMETFCLGLIWDYDTWTETVLSNLEEELEENNAPRLLVKRIRIKNLAKHIEELFEKIGFGESSNDD